MKIRPAIEKDIAQVTKIYNYEAVHSTATFDREAKTLEDRLQWFRAHTGNHPVLVAEMDEKIVAYASLSSYRNKEAYDSTAELSVYVHRDYRGRGVGKAMMKAILELAAANPALHTVVSVITAGNETSDRLHRSLGFEYCGRVREAGMKFGKYLDIDTYQIMV